MAVLPGVDKPPPLELFWLVDCRVGEADDLAVTVDVESSGFWVVVGFTTEVRTTTEADADSPGAVVLGVMTEVTRTVDGSCDDAVTDDVTVASLDDEAA